MDTYSSDITRAVPVANGGKFTEECRGVYEAVLDMQEVTWRPMRIRPFHG